MLLKLFYFSLLRFLEPIKRFTFKMDSSIHDSYICDSFTGAN
jgi:hypothetical protein